jgi:cell division transport system permease protein
MSSKTSKRKPSFIPAILSITLVLFVIGMLSVVTIYTGRLIDYLKENVQVVLYFNSGTPDDKVKGVEKSIMAMPYVKETKFVGSEEAALLFKEELGEDFTEVLGGNPLPPSIEVYLKGNTLDRSRMDSVVNEFKTIPMVYEVNSQSDLIDDINTNKNRLSYIMGGIGAILLIVAFVLMNSTVRLAVYSKRFIIKSMQLVGATEWFIIRPFIRNSFYWVLFGASIATLLTAGLYMYGASWLSKNVYNSEGSLFSAKSLLAELPVFGGIFAFLLVIGLLVIIPGTYVSTKRYLSLKIDDLY